MNETEQLTCHCGKPLHYTDQKIKAQMMNIIKKMGEFIQINYEGKNYQVSRHYIALHGIKGSDLHKLGFKEV